MFIVVCCLFSGRLCDLYVKKFRKSKVLCKFATLK